MSDHQAPAETRETEHVGRYRLVGTTDVEGCWMPTHLDLHESGEWVAYVSFSKVRAALAAARREVETAQAEVRLRGETVDALRREVAGWEQRTKELGSVVLRAWEVLRKWWQFSKLEERDEPFADALARAIAADREHDAYALGEMQRLNVVIETVTRERQDYRESYLIHEETARVLRIENARLCAALEDVRRVREWLSGGADGERAVMCGGATVDAVVRGAGRSPACFAEGDSIPALGRALAQEAGDGR